METACLRQDCVQREHTNDCRITRAAQQRQNVYFQKQQTLQNTLLMRKDLCNKPRNNGSMSSFKNIERF